MSEVAMAKNVEENARSAKASLSASSVPEPIAPEVAHSRVITVGDNDTYLQLMDQMVSQEPHVVRVPYFNHLTKAEKAECLRIFENVDVNTIRKISYHYHNDRSPENGYTYIADNLKYILNLNSNNDPESDYVKYLMIASLGKMKFLSKRNVNFVFSMRSFLYRTVTDLGAGRKHLSKILDPFSYTTRGIDSKEIYSDSAEQAYYAFSTIHRWLNYDKETLREIVMKQEVFGSDIDELISPASMPVTVSAFAAEIVKEVFLNSLDNPWKIFNEKHSKFGKFAKLNGLMDRTVNDFMFYDGFANWTNKDATSFVDFFEKYKVDTSGYAKSLFDEFVFELIEKNHLDNPRRLRRKYALDKKAYSSSRVSYSAYYVFCLLKFDKDKFVELVETTGLLSSSPNGRIFTYSEAFLEIVKEFSNDTSNVPLSYLLNIYGYDVKK